MTVLLCWVSFMMSVANMLSVAMLNVFKLSVLVPNWRLKLYYQKRKLRHIYSKGVTYDHHLCSSFTGHRTVELECLPTGKPFEPSSSQDSLWQNKFLLRKVPKTKLKCSDHCSSERYLFVRSSWTELWISNCSLPLKRSSTWVGSSHNQKYQTIWKG